MATQTFRLTSHTTMTMRYNNFFGIEIYGIKKTNNNNLKFI